MFSLASPAIVGPAGANFICVVGSVKLLQVVRQPVPGSLTGFLITVLGTPIPLVLTSPATMSGVPLSSVDGQLATVCGDLTTVQGQLALDVRFVSPGFSPGTPGVNPFQLLPLFGRSWS